MFCLLNGTFGENWNSQRKQNKRFLPRLWFFLEIIPRSLHFLILFHSRSSRTPFLDYMALLFSVLRLRLFIACPTPLVYGWQNEYTMWGEGKENTKRGSQNREKNETKRDAGNNRKRLSGDEDDEKKNAFKLQDIHIENHRSMRLDRWRSSTSGRNGK